MVDALAGQTDDFPCVATYLWCKLFFAYWYEILACSIWAATLRFTSHLDEMWLKFHTHTKMTLEATSVYRGHTSQAAQGQDIEWELCVLWIWHSRTQVHCGLSSRYLRWQFNILNSTTSHIKSVFFLHPSYVLFHSSKTAHFEYLVCSYSKPAVSSTYF